MRKLNFGSGSIIREGWENLDNNTTFTAHFRQLSEVPSESMGLIVAHCSVQINDWHDLPTLFHTLYRVLDVGGVLHISLPDIIAGFEAYKRGDINWFPNGEQELELRFSAWLTWYSTTRSLLTEGALKLLLKDAGFRIIETMAFNSSLHPNGAELDTREGECYFIDAVK